MKYQVETTDKYCVIEGDFFEITPAGFLLIREYSKEYDACTVAAFHPSKWESVTQTDD